MLTTTIGDLLDGNLDELDEGNHCLYVVRDGEMIFYVGKSREPVNRLWSHLGRGWGAWSMNGPSRLGLLIADNLPAARSWQIEFLTPGDCGMSGYSVRGFTREEWEKPYLIDLASEENPFGLAQRMNEVGFGWTPDFAEPCTMYRDWEVEKAEVELIKQLKPCLNVIHNSSPSILPECYRKIDLDVTASDFIPW